MASSCPLCESVQLATCLERDSVPVFQNVRYPSSAAARAAGSGRLAIAHCERCGFVFNAAFDPQLAVYSTAYENDQTLSEHFRGYLERIGAHVLRAVADKPDPLVLEVGCGQAAFLKQLAQLPQARYSRFLGFDPAWRGSDVPSKVDVRPTLFDGAAVAELRSPIDAVVSRHVIEHIADPIAFLQDIRRAIGASAQPRLMLETPSLEWIVERDVLFDFFYEHCSYFTVETLRYAVARAGYRALRIERMFDGQYLWVEAEPAPALANSATPPAPTGLGPAIAAMGRRGTARLAAWRDGLASHRGRGTLALWGAGAKGATLAALADPDGTLIDCLIDINPRKQGGFIAVTGHPIVAPADAAGRGVRAVVLMNPNYRAEVLAMIGTASLPFTLIDGP
jgi:SAM-dependent methyltransferase